MSYNNFYSNIRGNNLTFQRFPPPNLVPPPPRPPPFFIPPSQPWSTEISDQEYIKNVECKISQVELKKINIKTVSISQVRQELHNTLLLLNDLKAKEKLLTDKLETLPEEEWSTNIKKIQENKILIDKTLSHINGSCLDMLRKVIAKRTAKRLRLKRVNIERKKERDERIKDSKERSRKIDENLQKIKDEITRVKQEEEAKIQADIVLKEVLRKKHDAKRCVVKLDALVKLRKARHNTARGRGENVADSHGVTFNANIEKLKSLWTQKLAVYEKEEAELRAKLKQDSTVLSSSVSETAREVQANLDQWSDKLFGGGMPQVDFGGDIARFVGVRSRWDRYISSEGSALPVGWVLPTAPW